MVFRENHSIHAGIETEHFSAVTSLTVEVRGRFAYKL